MSTGARISLQLAATMARDFCRAFEGTADRWEIAGSVRRESLYVGDVEHVVIPKRTTEPGKNLFVEPVEVNLVWKRLDHLLAVGTVEKALYTNSKTGAVSPRWGDLMRGVMYQGLKHEIYLAAPETWGAKLLIRTGPWEYSRNVVDAIKRGGMYRQQDGVLRRVADGQVIPVETEQEYCRLACVPFYEPRERALHAWTKLTGE